MLEMSTIIPGTLCFDGKPTGIKLDQVETFNESEEKANSSSTDYRMLTNGITFECHSFPIKLTEELKEELLGITRKRKKAKPIRKRLLLRQRRLFGYGGSYDFVLIPNGDGTWKATLNECTLNVNIHKKERKETNHGNQGSVV